MTASAPQCQPMTGHTLLPWAVSSHDGQPSRGWIKSICKGFPERMVAQVLGQSTVEEREANAALIVEAVNSHAALTARVSELEGLFAAADDKDWQRLSDLLGYSAHGQFWREIFINLRAALPPIPGEASHD